MYAFEGGTGTLRWKHKDLDIHQDAAELQHRQQPDIGNLLQEHRVKGGGHLPPFLHVCL